jgi:hypothetical protein
MGAEPQEQQTPTKNRFRRIRGAETAMRLANYSARRIRRGGLPPRPNIGGGAGLAASPSVA